MWSKPIEERMAAAVQRHLNAAAQTAPDFDQMWSAAERAAATEYQRRARWAGWALAAAILLAIVSIFRAPSAPVDISRWQAPTDYLLQYSRPQVLGSVSLRAKPEAALEPIAIWNWREPTAGLIPSSSDSLLSQEKQILF